jgi:hypothetical protein
MLQVGATGIEEEEKEEEGGGGGGGRRHLELPAVTAPPLISTIQKSQQPLILFQPACCLHQPFPGNGF